MIPEDLMPVQGSSLTSPTFRLRHLKVFTALAAGFMAGMLALSGHLAAPPAAQWSSASFGTGDESVIIALCRSGRADEAWTVSSAWLARTAPDSSTAARIHYLRGGILRLRGLVPEARSEYLTSARMSAPRVTDDEEMDMLAQGGDWSSESSLARQMIREQPSDPYAVNNSCWELVMYPGGDPAQAAHLMAPIVRTSEDAAWSDTYAWSLFLSGRRSEAIQQEERALVINVQGHGDCTCEWNNNEHQAYIQACIQGMNGNPGIAVHQLRKLFQDDITFTCAWAAADHFEDMAFH